MPSLRVLNGPDAGKSYPLATDKMVMGRHPDCDVIVEAVAVSRFHAQLQRIGHQYQIEDLQSRNGTLLNDQPVSVPTPLEDLDRIGICDIMLEYRATDSESQEAPVQGPSGLLATAILVDDVLPDQQSSIMGKLALSSKHGRLELAVGDDVKLRALIELTRNLHGALSEEKILPYGLETLFQVFPQADRAFIALKDEHGEVVPRATKFRAGIADTIRVSRTILQHVMDQQEAILSADAADDERFALSQSIANFQIRSMMCAPLIDGQGTVWGAMQVDTMDQRRRFRQSDLEVLAAVASQAAVAVDNAHLHEKAVEQRAFERELQLAHRVQLDLLPRRRPELAGYQFHDFYQAANQIGGDFFDYVTLPDGRVVVVVADVVGHGIAAALSMARVSAHTRFCLATAERPKEVLTNLNAMLCEETDEDRFVTLVMAVIDPRDDSLVIANAGHQPPFCRRNGEVTELGEEAGGPPLGIIEGIEYDESRHDFVAGDVVLMFTDGISEAANTDHEQFGLDRIRQQLAGDWPTLQDFSQQLIHQLKRFVGDQPQSDDICLTCVARNK